MPGGRRSGTARGTAEAQGRAEPPTPCRAVPSHAVPSLSPVPAASSSTDSPVAARSGPIPPTARGARAVTCAAHPAGARPRPRPQGAGPRLARRPPFLTRARRRRPLSPSPSFSLKMAAAGGGGPVRLRLLFDYPPPGSPGCALCWLLLEPSQVRLVTDLVSLIRHRFGFSRRARLSLFLEGALLPPTESARLVRDNDSLRYGGGCPGPEAQPSAGEGLLGVGVSPSRLERRPPPAAGQGRGLVVPSPGNRRALGPLPRLPVAQRLSWGGGGKRAPFPKPAVPEKPQGV